MLCSLFIMVWGSAPDMHNRKKRKKKATSVRVGIDPEPLDCVSQ